jgi:hypothetical protein
MVVGRLRFLGVHRDNEIGSSGEVVLERMYMTDGVHGTATGQGARPSARMSTPGVLAGGGSTAMGACWPLRSCWAARGRKWD